MQSTETMPVYTRVPAPPAGWFDAFMRRTLDIAASAFGLLLLSPLFLLVAVLLKRDTPGPVFYRGPRVGRGGRTFGMLKFRTMYERPASYQGARITAQDDQRITPLGRWLRDTKINELPQLWNVLVGDMSLVGPRPEDPEFVAKWPAAQRRVLLSVRPGVTSPATVTFRGEERLLQSSSVVDDYLRSIMPTKLRIDTLYIRNRTFLTDLDVLFMTVALLIPRVRDVDVPITVLYWGPLSRFVSRFLNWFVMDTLVAFFAVSLAGLIWRTDAPLNIGVRSAVALAGLMAFSFSFVNLLFGMERISWRRAQASEVFPLALSSAVAWCVLIVLKLLVKGGGPSFDFIAHAPTGLMMNSAVFALLGFVAMRYRARLLTGLASRWLRARGERSAVGERVLMVGGGDSSQFATWLFTRSELARAFSITGIVDDDPRKQGLVIDGYKVLGTCRDIPALVQRLDIGLVVFTISNISFEDRSYILQLCSKSEARVVVLPDLMAELNRHFQLSQPSVSPELDPSIPIAD